MNNEHKDTKTALQDGAPISAKKAYSAPSLRNLDGLEKTESGSNPSIAEATNGAATS